MQKVQEQEHHMACFSRYKGTSRLLNISTMTSKRKQLVANLLNVMWHEKLHYTHLSCNLCAALWYAIYDSFFFFFRNSACECVFYTIILTLRYLSCSCMCCHSLNENKKDKSEKKIKHLFFFFFKYFHRATG